jgi:hypothetical protein
VRTQRSVEAFKLGLLAESAKHFTPAAANVSRNEAQNFVSRSSAAALYHAPHSPNQHKSKQHESRGSGRQRIRGSDRHRLF